MSIREAEIARRARTHRKLTKLQRERRKQRLAEARTAERKQRIDALPAILNDDMVLTIAEWAALNRISLRTARRIISSGTGPRVTQLSAMRTGVTVRANREWQASRERTP
jgi:hypothetical protein